MVRKEAAIIPIPEKKLRLRGHDRPLKVKVLFIHDSSYLFLAISEPQRGRVRLNFSSKKGLVIIRRTEI